MKKLLAVCFAFALLASVAAYAQDTMNNDTMKHDDMKHDEKKAVELKGKISDDGMVFVGAKDSKSWKIVNPDAVKGHAGHEVVVTAHVYWDKDEIHVMSLKMAK